MHLFNSVNLVNILSFIKSNLHKSLTKLHLVNRRKRPRTSIVFHLFCKPHSVSVLFIKDIALHIPSQFSLKKAALAASALLVGRV